jgi:guanylate kinase
VEGQDYHFVSRGEFETLIGQDRFAEYASVHGNLYGTSLAELDRARDNGKRGILFDVDYQGARQIKASLPNAVGVFILPPTMGELRHRLEGRATDAPEVIQARFDKARLEIEHYLFFDYLIVNDQVEEAAAHLRGIVYAERSRRRHLAVQAEALLRTGYV